MDDCVWTLHIDYEYNVKVDPVYYVKVNVQSRVYLSIALSTKFELGSAIIQLSWECHFQYKYDTREHLPFPVSTPSVTTTKPDGY